MKIINLKLKIGEGLLLMLPGGESPIPVPSGFKYRGDDATVGKVLTDVLGIVFYLALFLAFFWLVWGAFQYMTSGGDKQKLGLARARITWAIVGLILVILAYVVAQFVGQVLRPTGGIPI